MRNDFKLDNRKVFLPKASTLGFGKSWAKQGNWISTAQNQMGRVLGRIVTSDKKTFLYCFMLSQDGDCIMVRWIDPVHVLTCVEGPPKEILKLVTMNWTDTDQILKELQDGIADKLEKGNMT